MCSAVKQSTRLLPGSSPTFPSLCSVLVHNAIIGKLSMTSVPSYQRSLMYYLGAPLQAGFQKSFDEKTPRNMSHVPCTCRALQVEAARKSEGEQRGRAQDEAAEARARLKRLDKELRAVQVRCRGC